ncbi:MAG: FtsQ-type POTRA domain-containing protein [Candidatus Magasanikbacteria bacterium]
MLDTKRTTHPRKDFAWHRSKRNPMWRDPETPNWRKRLEIIILLSSVVGMLGIGIYSSFFKINDINIDGIQRIDQNELKEAVQGVINYKKLFIFPGNNYFVVNVDEIRDIVKERFPIESIIVKKIFPNTVEIALLEKISTIIYDNGSEYCYLDTNGRVVELIRKVGEDEWLNKTEIVTTTNELGEEISEEKIIEQTHIPNITQIVKEMGDYPILYDTRKQMVEINSEVINEKFVRGIIDWFNLINKNTSIPFKYIIIDNGIGDAVIKTKEGWDIVVRLEENVETQFHELQYILKERINQKPINYVDLRFLGKVYWQ